MAAPPAELALVGGAHALAAEALAWTLTHSGHRVIGSFESVDELDATLRSGAPCPRAAVLDIDDPAVGLAGVTELRHAYPGIAIMILSDSVTPSVVRSTTCARVEGVVVKSDGVEDLLLALGHVLAGRAVMPSGWQAAAANPSSGARLARLSRREREVLELVALGLTNREIADRLSISTNTVKFHLRTVYSTLGARNRVEAMSLHSSPADRPPQGEGRD